MHVVAVLDELVYCEYLIGTEPHRRTIRASELGLVFQGSETVLGAHYRRTSG
jgi:hypothetical protein